MVCNVGACVQRDGQAGRGGVWTDGVMSKRAEEQPREQTDVGDTLYEFFRSEREEDRVNNERLLFHWHPVFKGWPFASKDLKENKGMEFL